MSDLAPVKADNLGGEQPTARPSPKSW